MIVRVLLAGVLLLGAGVAAAQGSAGAVRGSVVDADWDVPVAGVTVTVIGTRLTGVTDENGNFRIDEVPPGSYTLTFSAAGYERKLVSAVVVTIGRLTDLQVELRADYIEMEEVVVSGADLLGDTEVGLLNIRQTAVASIDAISTELISQAGASDVASALTKVVGTTVVEGKYATVRGLSDRYTGTTLNGVRLPSADPRKRAVQVDLFPTGTVDNVTVTKTFTPDLQGDFTGGGVDIRTKSVPDGLTLSFSTSYAHNTEATGNERFLSYIGGGVEPFGSMPERDLPEEAGTELPSFPTTSPRPTADDVATAEVYDRYTRAFQPVIGVSRQTSDADTGFSLVIGDRLEAGGVVIGALGAVNYTRKFDFYERGVNNSAVRTAPTSGLAVLKERSDSKGKEEYLGGTLATLVVQPRPGHEIALRYVANQAAEDEARFQEERTGFPEVERNQTLHYTERKVRSWQLAGTHRLSAMFDHGGPLRELAIDWVASDNYTNQYEPDVRYFRNLFRYDTLAATTPRNTTFAQNIRRIFRDIEEFGEQYAVNAALGFEQWGGLPGRFKVGVFSESGDRGYLQDSFTYRFQRQVGRNATVSENNLKGFYQADDPEDLWTDVFLAPDRVGLSDNRCEVGQNPFLVDCASPNQVLWVVVPTGSDVNYDGRQKIEAWYWMLELPLTARLELVGGVRRESTEITVVPYNDEFGLIAQIIQDDVGNRFLDNATPQEEGRAEIDDAATLPSVGLNFQPAANMKLRASWSRTIARPTFRELAPVATEEFVAGDEFFGNNRLTISKIENYDFRWEWFPRAGEILAASWFYKQIEDPIEYLSFGASNRFFIQPVNFETGRVRGFELEARTTLGRIAMFDDAVDEDSGIAKVLGRLTLGANYTGIDSWVDVPPFEQKSLAAFGLSEPRRSLQGQPEYAANVFLTYDDPDRGISAGVFYNRVGETLLTGAARGDDGTPDVYDTPLSTLDATFRKRIARHFAVSLKAKNLLTPDDERIYRTPDGLEAVKSTRETASVYSVSISWKW